MTTKKTCLHRRERGFAVSLVGMATLIVLGEPPHAAQAETATVADAAIAAATTAISAPAVAGGTSQLIAQLAQPAAAPAAPTALAQIQAQQQQLAELGNGPASVAAPTTGVTATTAQSDFQWSVNEGTGGATLTGVNGNLQLGAVVVPDTVTLNGETYPVTAIGVGAFQSQESLTSISFGANLQTIGANAFVYDAQLAKVDFSQATQLTTIGANAFQSDGSLTNVDLPQNLTELGDGAFEYSGVTNVNVPASLTSLAAETFTSCTKLAQVTFAPDAQLQTIGASAFAYTSALTGFDLPEAVKEIGAQAFAGSGLESFTIPATSQLTTISAGAFMYDDHLLAFTFPDTLTTIGEQAFLGASSIPHVSFGPNLTTIGEQAFLYDQGLISADFNRATALTTIGAQAFEYCGLTGALNLPQNLITIADGAFAGNHITAIGFPTALKTIGASAFAYNVIPGTLRIPASVTTIGADGFLGNQLEAVVLDGSQVDLGNDVFTYNRITTIHGQTIVNEDVIGRQNMATIFTDPAHVSIGDFFSLAYDGRSGIEQDLSISDLTNGVTYHNGQFIVPTGTTDFYFDWDLPQNGATIYSGHYHVVLSNPEIKAVDSTVLMGTFWNADDNFLSAVLDDGHVLTLSDLTVSVQDPQGNSVPTVDSTKGGAYKVTYSYGNYATTVTVTVAKRPGSYTLTGSSHAPYTGQNQAVGATDPYQVILSNGTKYTLKSGDLELAAGTTATNVGQYSVTLSKQGLTNIQSFNTENAYYDWTQAANSQADLTVTPAPVTITANDAMKYTGDQDPELTATVNNPAAATGGAAIAYQLARTAGETAGSYPITVTATASANPNYTISTTPGTLTIKVSQQSISALPFTMTAGDPAPTVDDFQAKATDKNGDASTLSLDLGNSDLKTPGNYQVTLHSADGQSKEVTLTILPNLATLTGADFTTYLNHPLPTLADLQAKATDKKGQEQPVSADFSQVKMDQIGDYNVVLSTAAGLEKTVVVHVVASQAQISGNDFTMYVGQTEPTVADFKGAAQDDSGANLAVTADFSQVAWQTPGDYAVTLHAGANLSKVVTLHLLASKKGIHGQNFTMYVGDAQPTAKDFQAVAQDDAGNGLSVTAVLDQVDFQKPGEYPVKLTASDGQTLAVTLTLLANQQSLTGNDASMYVGDPLPTVTNFAAQATDKSGQEIGVDADLSQVNDQVPGKYPVLLTAVDGQKKTVYLTVKPDLASLTAKNFAMFIGDPTPTVANFQAVATDRDGQPETVYLDLREADLTMPGKYPVTLTTASGEQVVVKLTVIAKYHQPEEPDNPENPENPEKPVNPDNPEKPENPEKPTKPENPEKPTKPTKPTKPSQPSKPTVPSKPTKPSQPTTPQQPGGGQPTGTTNRPTNNPENQPSLNQGALNEHKLPQANEQRHIWPVIIGGLMLGLVTLGSWFDKFRHHGTHTPPKNQIK
ncbi:leucine-rich repeat protein [Lapidilactobacillus salsurivasis]